MTCRTGTCYFGRCAPTGWAFVPAGDFMMGSPTTEWGRVAAEEPLHHVTLTRDFLVSTHEVTQREFTTLMGFNPSFFTNCGDDCPVDQVRWVVALAYANALSRSEGLPECYDLSACTGVPGPAFRCTPPLTMSLDCLGYRLPTEAEWEYAYRAGTNTMFYNGDPERYTNCDQPLLQEIAQFCGNCSVTYGQVFDCSMSGLRPSQPTDCGPTAVMLRAPNAWGIYDMSGNIQELVWDTRGPYEGDAVDPTGPSEQTGYVRKRGAGFCGHMARLRAADRKFTTWTDGPVAQGFRLVRTVPAP
ncbi:MAG: formylglycine-generating enzyme family protein [Sandaracinaceae bacterium]|nr:formylglycine-generating enzyme family protein [Sandaracinaceae bacterium]